MRIGIDLDGVCYDFAAAVRHHVITKGILAPEACANATRWEFYEDWGLNTGAFLAVCHDGVNDGVIFTHGAPHHGVKKAWHRLITAGHTIHVITDRSFGSKGASQAATVEWLRVHDLPYDSITFTSDKTIVAVDAMVDDKPENYAALTAAGVETYLLTQPWNAHVDGAHRVNDLTDFADLFAPRNGTSRRRLAWRRHHARMTTVHDTRRDRVHAAQARQDAARRDELGLNGKHGADL